MIYTIKHMLYKDNEQESIEQVLVILFCFIAVNVRTNQPTNAFHFWTYKVKTSCGSFNDIERWS